MLYTFELGSSIGFNVRNLRRDKWAKLSYQSYTKCVKNFFKQLEKRRLWVNL